MYQGYISRITESVSGIHVKDYRECIRDTCQGIQKVYQGYMLKITESESGIHIKDYWELDLGYMLKITESVSGIHTLEYRLSRIQIDIGYGIRVNLEFLIVIYRDWYWLWYSWGTSNSRLICNMDWYGSESIFRSRAFTDKK